MPGSNGLRSAIECPICFEVRRGRLFQCVNGHLICEGCKDSTG